MILSFLLLTGILLHLAESSYMVKTHCSPESISISVLTSGPFFGRIAAGSKEECSMQGLGETELKLTVDLDSNNQCGVALVEGMFVFILHVRGHHMVELKDDPSFLIQCPAGVTEYDLSDRPLPSLQYASVNILERGKYVSTVATGGTYYIDVDVPTSYAYRVGQCSAFGTTSKTGHVTFVTLTDSRGCPLDSSLMDQFTISKDDGRLKAKLKIYRFNDTHQFSVQCAIEHCGYVECAQPHCESNVHRDDWSAAAPLTAQSTSTNQVLASSTVYVQDAPISQEILDSSLCIPHKDSKLVLLSILLFMLISFNIVSIAFAIKNRPWKFKIVPRDSSDLSQKPSTPCGSVRSNEPLIKVPKSGSTLNPKKAGKKAPRPPSPTVGSLFDPYLVTAPSTLNDLIAKSESLRSKESNASTLDASEADSQQTKAADDREKASPLELQANSPGSQSQDSPPGLQPSSSQGEEPETRRNNTVYETPNTLNRRESTESNETVTTNDPLTNPRDRNQLMNAILKDGLAPTKPKKRAKRCPNPAPPTLEPLYEAATTPPKRFIQAKRATNELMQQIHGTMPHVTSRKSHEFEDIYGIATPPQTICEVSQSAALDLHTPQPKTLDREPRAPRPRFCAPPPPKSRPTRPAPPAPSVGGPPKMCIPLPPCKIQATNGPTLRQSPVYKTMPICYKSQADFYRERIRPSSMPPPAEHNALRSQPETQSDLV